ncbi:permease-like cell division protein FtsX [Bacteroides gallinaceum]|uniref:cell division protein FtsX n=1 Tax=Bacteroides gallinaceum TaxID=1462571 RepID=UPI0015B2974E|nr:permease-like cell division protein FtsX [Bacteroides gallinaceum]MDM8154044.1 permease-like cell division protein FtsX [Bacteroides gallinaceum]
MSRRSGAWIDMQFITASISTMLVLLLLGAVVFFVLAANNLSVYVRENIAFSVLVSDDMKETDILRFQKELNAKPYVKHTDYISKKQALAEQSEAMGTDPAEFLGYNPFTASIEVRLNADYANSDSVAWIKDEILSNKEVIEINYPQDLLDAVNRNIRKISLILLGIAALLALISFALINNTIRLTIYSQRFLINTMKLVGASWAFIRRPFLKRNAWVGILAGIMADTVLAVIAYALVRYEPDLLAIVTPEVMITVMGVVFLFGVVITTLCALVSINRYLRMKTNELYYN